MLIQTALSASLAFAVTFIVAKLIADGRIRVPRGTDIHKPVGQRRSVPRLGGLSVLMGVSVGYGAVVLLGGFDVRWAAAFSSALIAGVIGLVDDYFELNEVVKPALVIFASLPLFLTGVYDPHPALPFVPRTRITVIYRILLLFSITVPANAVNMLDVLNGVTPITTIPVFLAILVSGLFLRGLIDPLSALAIASLLALLYYNRYPARVFVGNVGDMFIGGMIGALAVVDRVEIVAIVALMPHIMNGFSSLASIKRLFTKTNVERPTVIDDEGYIHDSGRPGAPLTLTRLIVAGGPKSEREIVAIYACLSLLSMILALATAALTVVRI